MVTSSSRAGPLSQPVEAKVSDTSSLAPVIQAVIDAHPDEVLRYRGGNKRLVGFFIGQAMKATGGTADPVVVRELVQQLLDA